MNPISPLDSFAGRLLHRLSQGRSISNFNDLALELFALQFRCNDAYADFCRSRGVSPQDINRWEEIPAVPSAGFKERELSCIPSSDRSTVFHSSGTTEQRPSRHFHHEKSLQVYEASALAWFERRLMPETSDSWLAVALAPSGAQAPHSSLVHMFETLRLRAKFAGFLFTGSAGADGSWMIDGDNTTRVLQQATHTQQPVVLLGTAFSYVHLLDFMSAQQISLQLPGGSLVMETGGYKGRSRVLPKSQLHWLLSSKLGVPDSHIICEYGMSELSSQAYDRIVSPGNKPNTTLHGKERIFQFPPWARAQMVSPETGLQVEEGQIGLIRVFDMANVYSVMAVQTEDLARRRGEGFELIGRATMAGSRGCSLMLQ